MTPTTRKSRRQRGQALTEYIVVVAVVFISMFAPTPLLRHPDSGDPISLFGLFIEAFDIYINSFHTVITLPVP